MHPASAQRWWLWLAVASATWPLPLAESGVPTAWLICWTAPSALLALSLPSLPRLWRRAAVAIALQGAAMAVAITWGPPLPRPALLACTILPPMAFAATRAGAQDVGLALFLGFCTLLVGRILGSPQGLALVGFGLGACGVLAGEARRLALAASGPHLDGPPQPRWLGFGLGAGALALAALLGGVLAAIPSPLHWSLGSPRASAAATAPPRRSAGLSRNFALGGGGLLADLRRDRLVRVRSTEGYEPPSDLYLRSGFFAEPGLDDWRIGSLEIERPRSEPAVLRAPVRGTPVLWLQIERFADARELVLAPPGTCTIRNAPGLRFDRRREWLQQPLDAGSSSYEVGYQELTSADAQIDGFAAASSQLSLLRMPAGIDQPRWSGLLDHFAVRGPVARVLAAVETGLATHCRYERREPTGPFRHALENFLFAPHDRHGFCMHFAAAGALLLRMAGVPCRIGVGLHGGTPDPEEPRALVFGSQHAHAWVEIPWQGRGYLVFDPTPAEYRGQVLPTDDAATPEPSAANPDATEAEDWLSAWRDAASQPWLMAAVLSLLFVLWLYPARRSTARLAAAPSSAAQRARRLLAQILRELAHRGMPRRHGQTLEQFAAELADRQRLPEPLAAAFRAYQEVRFGGRPFDAARLQALHAGAAAAATIAAAEPPTPSPASA